MSADQDFRRYGVRLGDIRQHVWMSVPFVKWTRVPHSANWTGGSYRYAIDHLPHHPPLQTAVLMGYQGITWP